MKWILNKRIVLAFHGVYDDSFVKQPLETSRIISSSDFEKIIKWLNGAFEFLTFDQYVNGEKGVLITFDDGYENNLTVALPLLEKYSAPAIVFVSCCHIKKEQNHSRMKPSSYPSFKQDEISTNNHYFDGLTHSQLRELNSSPLIEIGNHTFHHKDLVNLDYPDLKSEIQDATDFIERITGSRPRLFAYPFGSFSNTSIQVLNDLGYEYGFALENGVTKDDNLKIKRLGIYRSDKWYLTCKLSVIYDVYNKFNK